MPWSHCEREVIGDTDPCPECGTTKDKWTVEFQVTREFVIRRSRGLRIALRDRDDEGVGHEPYRVELPDGEVVEGELDEEGTARVATQQTGECTLSFPRRVAADVQPIEAEGEEGEGPMAVEGDVASFTCAIGPRHAFRIKPMLRLRFLRYGEPRAGESYRLLFGDAELTGELDDAGWLRVEVPAEASEGEVWIGEREGDDADPDHFRVAIGTLHHAGDVRGVQQRLNGMGFRCGAEDGDAGPITTGALKAFQAKHELTVTGELDDATRAKLVEVHGG